MNPPRKTTGLFLTPRGPYGRRLPERALHHLRASENDGKKPDPASKEMQGPVGQAGLDQIAERARTESEMDRNGVPRSLHPTGEMPGGGQVDKNGVPLSPQSQISPQRAGEITDPSRQPLPAPQVPKMTNKAFPLDSKQPPPPQQDFSAMSGLGPLRPTPKPQWKADGYDKIVVPPKRNILPKLPPYIPTFDFSHGYKGLRWSIPLGKDSK